MLRISAEIQQKLLLLLLLFCRSGKWKGSLCLMMPSLCSLFKIVTHSSLPIPLIQLYFFFSIYYHVTFCVTSFFFFNLEDEMVGWHHQLNRHESEQTLGGGEVCGSPACRMQSMGLQSRTYLATEQQWIISPITSCFQTRTSALQEPGFVLFTDIIQNPRRVPGIFAATQ